MPGIIYIHQDDILRNGTCIFDKRLFAALSSLEENIAACKVDVTKNRFIDDIDITDDEETVLIFSNLTTFPLARQFKRAKIIFINHDLSYYALFSDKNLISYLKGIYRYCQIKYYWKFCDFHFFISNLELKNSGLTKNARHLKVGVRQEIKSMHFEHIVPAAFFTGSYYWSLKRKALSKALKHGYNGHLKLIAYKASVYFNNCAAHFNMKMEKVDIDPYPSAIKIGVVTDNFLSGFKLKVLELISIGCCIASFADFSDEFIGIRHADLFIIKIKTISDIDAYFSVLTKMENVIEKYNSFHADILRNFSWVQSAESLLQAANQGRPKFQSNLANKARLVG
jgi:hypothetical protein